MRAIVLNDYDGPEVLEVSEIPDPEPQRGEVHVEVRATALNRADTLQRRGKYPPPGPEPDYEIPGLEFAGEVSGTGTEVQQWESGDRVFGLLAGGGYAEQVVVHPRMLMRIPGALNFNEAAAVPEVWFTAWDALTDKAEFKPGDTVLVHAAGSGVGTAAIQLGRMMGASRIIATTRSEWKLEKCEELGADHAVHTADGEFADAVDELTGGEGADVILDFIGADYLEQNLEAAALEGRIAHIATLGGARGEADLRKVLGKRLRLQGTTLRSRPVERKMALSQEFAEQVLPHFAAGHLEPVIDSVYPLEDAAGAHRYMEENRNFGKILLETG